MRLTLVVLGVPHMATGLGSVAGDTTLVTPRELHWSHGTIVGSIDGSNKTGSTQAFHLFPQVPWIFFLSMFHFAFTETLFACLLVAIYHYFFRI